jgi:DNA-binding LacI/PurR family transcriptional regulator
MKNLTLDDIAEMAGVSPATVSRVINNVVGTRSKARERVLQVIEETGFQPHAAARSLAAQQSKVVGLLVPAPASRVLAHLYLLQLVEQISQACQRYDYILSLFLTGDDTDEKELLPKITRKGFVDGLIVRVFEGQRNEPLLQKLAKIGIPFVVSGRPSFSQQVSYVAADNERASYQATSHLISLGRKRIGLLVGSLEPYHSQERLAGYRKALDDRGLAMDEKLIAIEGASGAYVTTQRLLQHQPDAIFMPTRVVLDVLRALRQAGLRVPEDIALVGFDDLPLAHQTDPPLTTMRQPMAAMGKQLVEILLDIIENGPHPARQVIFEQELVIRHSCGALKV